jgi:hypothetical protein
MRCYACKKYKIDVKGPSIERPFLFVCIDTLTVHAIESEPLASIENAYY